MPANTKPLFPITPNIGFARLTGANTAIDGTGTVSTIMTAGQFGARSDKIVLQSAGTNIATLLRIFLNNGNAQGTGTNNVLWLEVELPATTLSATKQNGPRFEIPMDLALPAGWKINVCLATAVAAGWHVAQAGGDF
jgi:hypothetical protein